MYIVHVTGIERDWVFTVKKNTLKTSKLTSESAFFYVKMHCPSLLKKE